MLVARGEQELRVTSVGFFARQGAVVLGRSFWYSMVPPGRAPEHERIAREVL